MADISDEHAEKLRKLYEVHDKFCDALKVVEQINDQLALTCQNDIRYALRGAIDCVRSAIERDDSRFDDHYGPALLGLKIAWHDVVDIIVAEFKVYLDEYVDRYTADITQEHLDYTDARQKIYDIHDLIRKTRRDRNARENVYDQITTQDLEPLINCYREAIKQEPVVAAKRKKERFKNTFLVLPVLIAVFWVSFNVFVYIEGKITGSVPMNDTPVDMAPADQ